MAQNSSETKRKRSSTEELSINADSKRLYRGLDDKEQNDFEEDPLFYSKAALRDHIGLTADGEDMEARAPVLFFIELSPPSARRGAACRLTSCDERIDERHYRFAVHPGKSHFSGSADFYHIQCFEKLVEFPEAAYLDRVTPLTGNMAGLRGLKGTSIIDGNYLVDAGASRLILEWKCSIGELMDARDGVATNPLDPDEDNLLRKAGSATAEVKRVKGMPDDLHQKLSGDLAPVESNGADDKDEWNLFEQYLPLPFNKPEHLYEPHSLSVMLAHWKADRILACRDEARLTDEVSEARQKLDDKALKAIQRLSMVHMPGFGVAFRASLY